MPVPYTQFAMKKDWAIGLRLRGCVPSSLPLGRLGEYLRKFAELIGDAEDVKFAGIVKGSAIVRASLDESTADRVFARLGSAQSANDPFPEKAANSIDDMMRSDGLHGEVVARSGAVILRFPGAKAPKSTIEPDVVVMQEDELTGVVMRIGGKDDTVPLLLQDLDGTYYEANVIGKDLAREIGQHLFGQAIRVYGQATWKKSADVPWKLERFKVRSYELVDETPIGDLLKTLADLPGLGWKQLQDPIGEWRKIRGN